MYTSLVSKFIDETGGISLAIMNEMNERFKVVLTLGIVPKGQSN